MTKKYQIVTEFVKDLSFETPDIETYLETKDNIPKYKLNLDINSRPLKNEIIEVNIILKLQETNLQRKRSNFEITYTAVVRVDKNITEKKEMEEIILSKIPTDIFPRVEDLFISSIKKSGFQNINIEKKIDFEKLYREKKTN